MKRWILLGIAVALCAGILIIGLTWTKVTPVDPAPRPDAASTPK